MVRFCVLASATNRADRILIIEIDRVTIAVAELHHTRIKLLSIIHVPDLDLISHGRASANPGELLTKLPSPSPTESGVQVGAAAEFGGVQQQIVLGISSIRG